MTTGKAIVGVLAGLTAGVALGFLFAPDRGAETRKKITRKGQDLADALNDKIEEKFDDLIGAVTGKVKKAKTAERNENELVE